ncbi:extracellular solute-binding protein [Paenibacillus spiritus]|uniref:Extracellular solute-binding protein n=1 Tax=Paenibacillus spiritus TaxID=2496557 RepID=A0A5J5FUU9_9BACL|nr:extracellular solute-binding protein [Paenibacillus spiritus]KAA8997544.1 extracellular solute-binding protein [Paenibacillus spiritus]
MRTDLLTRFGRLVAPLLKPAAACLALLLLLSCSGTQGGDEPVFLTFWTTSDDEETAFLREKIDLFQKEHPNIRVTLFKRPFPAATNEFKTAILGDQAVDIFRADNTWIPGYASLDIVYPLDSLITSSERSGFLGSALQAAMYQGKLYGLPSVVEVPALLYNKRLLAEAGYEQPPKTMEELKKAAAAATKDGHYGLYVSEDSYFALPYLWAFGGGMIGTRGEISIDSAPSRQGLSFMGELMRVGVTQPYSDFNNGYNTMIDDFKKGKSAMIITGPWAVGDVLKGREFAGAADSLGVAPIPSGPGGQGSPVGGQTLVINRYTQHPRESYELISYLTSAEIQAEQSRRLRTLPTQAAAYLDEELSEDDIVQGFRLQMDTARALPAIPEVSDLFLDFTSNLNVMLLGRLSVEEGTDRIANDWRSLLQIPSE